MRFALRYSNSSMRFERDASLDKYEKDCASCCKVLMSIPRALRQNNTMQDIFNERIAEYLPKHPIRFNHERY